MQTSQKYLYLTILYHSSINHTIIIGVRVSRQQLSLELESSDKNNKTVSLLY